MWIKWRYNDHGCSDEYKELEIPKGYTAPVDYLIETGRVPYWSERYSGSRIKWKKIKKPSQKTVRCEIARLKQEIKVRREHLKEMKSLLRTKT